MNCMEFSVLKLRQLKYSVVGSRHMHYSIHPINTILNKRRKILYWKQSIEWKTHRKKIRKSTCTMIRIKTGFDSWTNKRQVEINLRKPSCWWLQYNSIDNDQILPLIAYFSWTGFAGPWWFIFDSSIAAPQTSLSLHWCFAVQLKFWSLIHFRERVKSCSFNHSLSTQSEVKIAYEKFSYFWRSN